MEMRLRLLSFGESFVLYYHRDDIIVRIRVQDSHSLNGAKGTQERV